MDQEAIIIKEYQEAFRKYCKDGVIDLDNKLKIKFNFQVHRIHDFIDSFHRLIPPNRQSQYFVSLVEKGTAQKSIGYFTFPIKRNTLFVIPQRVIHSTTNISTDYDGYMVSFNLEFFLQNEFPKRHIVNRKIFKSSIRPYIDLNDEQARQLQTIFKFILTESNEKATDKEEIIAVKIIELLMTCDRLFAHEDALNPKEIYCDVSDKFNDLVQQHFKQHRTVSYYAKQLHIHPNQLNLKVKSHSGLTAKETIVNQIVLEAKTLLAATRLSVKEIAFELGFEHPEHFFSLFKRTEHITPAQYRLNIH